MIHDSHEHPPAQPLRSFRGSERCRRLLPMLLPLAAGCASTVRDWCELEVRQRPFEDIWNTVSTTARRHGMPEARESDRGRGVFYSRWRGGAYAFGRTERIRLRAELDRLTEAEGGDGWFLRYCVEKQTVDDMAYSLDPREEDWSFDGQDHDLEAVIGAQIRLALDLPLKS